MKVRDYFPLGKAKGKAFCNRVAERKWLLENLKAGKHSLVIAPRRYGKSSLVERVINTSDLVAVELNFNVCSDEQDVEAVIREGVSYLLGTALGPIEKVIRSIKNYVSRLTPKISLGPEYARLELTVDSETMPAVSIQESLKLAEGLLAEKKRFAVMILDEFQVVGAIAGGSGVEAAIRNAVQEMQHLSIIFSGSSRHLLQRMFEDESRPLYKLCRKRYLDRIEAIHYHTHLNHIAHLAWGLSLEQPVFDLIMSISERHPYYVNYLCDVIWTECHKLPKAQDVIAAWQLVVEEEKSDAQVEISQLSLGQKKILRYIVNHTGDNLLSGNTLNQVGMALSSVSSAIAGLLEKDAIEKYQNTYRIINPVVKSLLQDPS